MAELPKQIINGVEYYIDDEKRECRAVSNPSDRILYDDIEDYPHSYHFQKPKSPTPRTQQHEDQQDQGQAQ